MEITTILGIIVGFIAVIGAMIFKHISFSVFLNPAAFFVIIVGTIATILNSYPGKTLKSIGSLFRVLFTKQQGMSNKEILEIMVSLAALSRKEGLLALESKVEAINDPFIKKGIRMVVDGMNEDIIEGIMDAEITAMEDRHAINAGIFASAGTYAPTLGVLGAVFGLIAAMSHINDVDAMSEAIAAAFIATVLGIFTGYVLWNPFAKKLKVKSEQEVLIKHMIIEGVLSIQLGDSPAILQQKLLTVLPQSEQDELLN